LRQTIHAKVSLMPSGSQWGLVPACDTFHSSLSVEVVWKSVSFNSDEQQFRRELCVYEILPTVKFGQFVCHTKNV